MCGLFGPRRPTSRPVSPRPAPREIPGSPNPNPLPLERPRTLLSSEFIIAIDFGTTYSGVAWAHFEGSTNLEDGSSITRTLTEKIWVYKDWPRFSNSYAEKTPSVISYLTDPPIWGGRVRSQHRPQVSRFKLGLDPEKVRHVFGMESGEGMIGLDPKLGKNAVDVTADFLTQLIEYIETKALPKALGDQFLAAQSKLYVMTVPAIWSDRAKDSTRQAAARAGIPRDRLILVPEPEAAALFCATAGDELDLAKGDTFIICDAGGGTVDLIAYEITNRTPFKIRECTMGTGDTCGAFQLEEGFKSVFLEKLGRYGPSVVRSEVVMEDTVNYFEDKIKTSFNPYDYDDDTETYLVPVKWAPDIPEIRLEAGFLEFTREDCRRIFEPVFVAIRKLIEAQIKNVARNTGAIPKTLLLVGGLGSNQYLLQYLREYLNRDLQIKQPPYGVSAIMRGAVLHGLIHGDPSLDPIDQRVMRRSYGTELSDVFDPTTHPENLKFLDKLDGNFRCNVLKWYAKKGDRMQAAESKRIKCSFDYSLERYHSSEPLLHASRLYYCEADVAPKYSDGSVKVLCELAVNHRDIPATAFQLLRGLNGRKYYKVTYQLELTFGSELLFSLVHEGRILGSVTANYQ